MKEFFHKRLNIRLLREFKRSSSSVSSNLKSQKRAYWTIVFNFEFLSKLAFELVD
jgi:hypothetical protein